MANKSNPISEEVKEEVKVEAPVVNDIVDVNFDDIRKKKFRIDGDNNRILELNTSDLSVINRIEDSYPKLVALEQKASLMKVQSEGSDDDSLDEAVEKGNISQVLREIDSEMREIMDYIFDADVSEKCAPSGSMFDPFNGEFRYEYVLDKLTKLYETNLDKEYALMRKRINKHTDKYIRK